MDSFDIAPAENLEQNGPFQPDLLSSLMEPAEPNDSGRYREPTDFAALWAKWAPILMRGSARLLMLIVLCSYLHKYAAVSSILEARASLCYLSALDQPTDVGCVVGTEKILSTFHAE